MLSVSLSLSLTLVVGSLWTSGSPFTHTWNDQCEKQRPRPRLSNIHTHTHTHTCTRYRPVTWKGSLDRHLPTLCPLLSCNNKRILILIAQSQKMSNSLESTVSTISHLCLKFYCLPQKLSSVSYFRQSSQSSSHNLHKLCKWPLIKAVYLVMNIHACARLASKKSCLGNLKSQGALMNIQKNTCILPTDELSPNPEAMEPA